MSDATLVYDDDCGFCTWWAKTLADRADVTPVGFSELTDDQRDRLPEDYEERSHLLVDGEVYSGGASVEEAILRTEKAEGVRPLVEFLRQFDEYTDLRETAYQKIADRRRDLGAFLYTEPPASQSE